MTNKLILTDGTKSISVLDDTPGLWTYYSNAPRQEIDALYGRVSAVFRAFNLKATTVSSMPFTLNNLKTGEEYDNSATWENKVKFLPRPSELFRLDTLSYMHTNAVYNLFTKNIVGRSKGLRNAIPSAFMPVTEPITGNLLHIERRAGTQTEIYLPDGTLRGGDGTSPRLVYMWRFDHTTEVLPSPYTEAEAISNSAGIIYHADAWIQHFFARGGVVPMVISMKGMVAPEKKDAEEKGWTKWYHGLGDRFSRIFRVVNAEAMDVKTVGSGIEQLKDNVAYRQAIENIAMGTGMPLSLLLANSANYATAREEKATWFDSDIVPFCDWLAYEYNEQIFHLLNLHLEFHPETLDPQQEDETSRATAFSTYGDAFAKYPTYGLWRGMATTLGLEISDDLDTAAQEFYADKAERAEEMAKQTQPKEKPKQDAPEQASPESPAETEPEEEETKAVAEIKGNENSAMIALRIPDAIRTEIGIKYPFVDAETLGDLHITLIYLGDNRTLNHIDMIRAASDFAQYQAPIKGRLQGLARFVNGTETDPIVCTFDSPQMPNVYSALANALDTYHIPYHKDHGFIPHMTLAYIPSEADMPIDTIEPIEVNFSEVYLVDGNEWFVIPLSGYGNKNAPRGWTLDEAKELSLYRDVMLRRWRKKQPMDYEYEPAYGGLPAGYMAEVKARLLAAQSEEDVRAAFEIAGDDAPVAERKSELSADPSIMALAESINKLAESYKEIGK